MELDAFVHGHYATLLRRAVLLTGSVTDGEDLIQEALARAWLRSRAGAVIEHPGAYLDRVMVNLAVSRWRRRRRLRVVSTPCPPEPAAGTDPTDRLGEQDRVWAAMNTLSPRRRAVLVLRYYEDLPEGRVAEVLGVSVGTVRSQTWKALRQLRSQLGEPTMEGPHA